MLGINPSGQVFRKSFALTANFIFWTAAIDPRASALFQSLAGQESERAGSLGLDLTRDPEFRLSIAAAYLGTVVFPAFAAELSGVAATSGLSWRNRLTETFGREHYPLEAARSLRSFANVHTSAQRDHESFAWLTAIETYYLAQELS